MSELHWGTCCDVFNTANTQHLLISSSVQQNLSAGSRWSRRKNECQQQVEGGWWSVHVRCETRSHQWAHLIQLVSASFKYKPPCSHTPDPAGSVLKVQYVCRWSAAAGVSRRRCAVCCSLLVVRMSWVISAKFHQSDLNRQVFFKSCSKTLSAVRQCELTTSRFSSSTSRLQPVSDSSLTRLKGSGLDTASSQGVNLIKEVWAPSLAPLITGNIKVSFGGKRRDLPLKGNKVEKYFWNVSLTFSKGC